MTRDPFTLLGVDPGVSEHELTATYRALAKQWHPDRRGGAGGEDRMAELNAAYEQARAVLRRTASRAGRTGEAPERRRPAPAAWLPTVVRKQLGWELLTALDDGERVEIVAQAGGAGRGPLRLVLTDRRLLWLLEDAVSARVDWVRDGLVEDVELRRPWLARRSAALRIRTRTGRRLAFADLEPDTAGAIAARLRERSLQGARLRGAQGG